MTKFPVGRTVATRGALQFLEENGIRPASLIRRHRCGDYGDLTLRDRKANDDAIVDGARILSGYKVGEVKVYVITEADRSMTTVLLASEY